MNKTVAFVSLAALALLGVALASPLWAFVVAVFVFTHIIILKLKSKWLSLSLLLTFYLKSALVMYHCFVTRLPLSNDDAAAFNDYSAIIADSLRHGIQADIGISGWRLYTSFMGYLYYLLGTEEVIPLLINVMLSVFTIILIYSITKLMSNSEKIATNAGIIAAIFPNLMLNSILNLREMPIIFFASLGFFLFLKWLKKGEFRNIMLSCLFTLISGAFHGGMIYIVFVYGILFSMYSPKTRKWSVLSFRVVLSLILMSSVFVVYTKYFENKSNLSVSNIDQISSTMSSSRVQTARAAYLTDMNPISVTDLVKYAPIRTLYFLAKPFPWDVRSSMDIFGLIDASFYWLFIFHLFRFLRRVRTEDPPMFWTILLLCIVEFSIFSWGTTNYGTAIRHRLKLIWFILPVVCIGYCMGKEKIRISQPKKRTAFQTTPKQSTIFAISIVFLMLSIGGAVSLWLS